MVAVYLDTNVYDHIDKRLMPAEAVEAFISARQRGEVTGYLSFLDVEELLALWGRDTAAAVRQLQLADQVIGFENLLRQPADLLRDAIRAYATATAPPPPLLPENERRHIASELRRITEQSAGVEPTVEAIVADVRRNKESFLADMRQGGAQVRAELGNPRRMRGITFDQFWEQAKAGWAEAFADYCGLAAECRQRGLCGLLKIREVRLAVGAALSLVFAQTVHGRRPDIGDGYDLWHAVAASVADVFVVRDQQFAGLLKRIPIEGFRVVTGLEEVLGDRAETK